jgi:hypothetical protein
MAKLLINVTQLTLEADRVPDPLRAPRGAGGGIRGAR